LGWFLSEERRCCVFIPMVQRAAVRPEPVDPKGERSSTTAIRREAHFDKLSANGVFKPLLFKGGVGVVSLG